MFAQDGLFAGLDSLFDGCRLIYLLIDGPVLTFASWHIIGCLLHQCGVVVSVDSESGTEMVPSLTSAKTRRGTLAVLL